MAYQSHTSKSNIASMMSDLSGLVIGVLKDRACTEMMENITEMKREIEKLRNENKKLQCQQDLTIKVLHPVENWNCVEESKIVYASCGLLSAVLWSDSGTSLQEHVECRL